MKNKYPENPEDPEYFGIVWGSARGGGLVTIHQGSGKCHNGFKFAMGVSTQRPDLSNLGLDVQGHLLDKKECAFC